MTPFLGQIMMVGFNFAPAGWALCDGQLLTISSNSALFSLIGTTFGGDGINTFALPDLRGRVAIHVGTGPGLSTYTWGQRGGDETVTLTESQIPNHTHTLRASGAVAGDQMPDSNLVAETGEDAYSSDTSGVVPMSGAAIAGTGGGGAHPNRQPFLGVYHVIAVSGVFPPT